MQEILTPSAILQENGELIPAFQSSIEALCHRTQVIKLSKFQDPFQVLRVLKLLEQHLNEAGIFPEDLVAAEGQKAKHCF